MLKFKSVLIIAMVTVISIVLLARCNKLENFQSNKPNIEYKKVQGIKHIFAENIENKTVVEVQNGVVCFFNVDNSKTTYSNAITLIPSKKSSITQIKKFLSNKNITFDYELSHMSVKNKNSTLIFVVDNEDGIKFKNEYSGNDEIIHLLQMSFMKQNSFLLKNSDRSISVNEYIKHVVVNNNKFHDGTEKPDVVHCTAGGIGSTSCTVGDIYSNCSVSCSDGYYACCDGSDNTCFCVKIPDTDR